MKVLLIGPIEVTDKMYFAPPLGIHRMGSFLRRQGIETRVVDPAIEPIPDSEDFDIIGYSVLGTSVDRSIEHARGIKRRKGQKIVFGGYEATFNYEYIIDQAHADAVVLGEGEYPLLHMAQHAEHGPYPGIVNARDGRILDMTPAEALSVDQFRRVTLDLEYDQIPFPAYWEKNETKIGADFKAVETRAIRLYLKNRCAFKCNFCSSANFYKAACGGKQPRVTTIEPARVAKLISQLVATFPDVRTFFFQDDEIFTPNEYIMDLCREIMKRPELAHIKYFCQGRIDQIPADLLPLLKESGFTKLILGIENFSANILRELSPMKARKMEKYSERISSILSHGIVPFLNIILTSPGATLEDVLYCAGRCLDEAEKGAELGMNLFTNAWKGSEMAAGDYRRDGINILPDDLELSSLLLSVDQKYAELVALARSEVGNLRITSTTRSVVYLLLIANEIDRQEMVFRCLHLVGSYAIIPDVAKDQQAERMAARVQTITGRHIN